MRAGLLNVLVQIQQQVVTQDEFGEPIVFWQAYTTTYATKKVMGGTESERFQQRVSSYDTEWRLRYRTPFDPRWRLREVVTGTIHDITFVADPTGRRKELICRTRIAEPQPATNAVP